MVDNAIPIGRLWTMEMIYPRRYFTLQSIKTRGFWYQLVLIDIDVCRFFMFKFIFFLLKQILRIILMKILTVSSRL